ncbi:MAG: FAD-binding oxidoreductase [Chloroflexota bacterium]
MTTENLASKVDSSALQAGLQLLAERLEGPVILPDHPDYNQARRVLEANFDCRPLAVVRPVNAGDVITAVNFARDMGLDISVRSGAHSPSGYGTCDDGLVIDFSLMKAIELDEATGTVRIEPGNTWGEVAQALFPHGLAISSGDFGSVGVGGLTTGGGIGWMVRKHGLTVDHLVGADVVLADGRLVHAGEQDNPDLFWAIRGGGGNFGVVVSFTFRPKQEAMITGGIIIYDYADAATVLRGFADYCYGAPDELTAMVDIMHAPPMPFLPPERIGSMIVGVTVCCAADPDRANEIIAPLTRLAEPIAVAVQPMPYHGMFAFTDHALPPEPQVDIRSHFADELSSELIATVVEQTAALPALSLWQLRALGGEMNRPAPDSVAFSHRDKPYMVASISIWTDPAESERHHSYAEGVWKALAPYASGAYVGFLGDEGEERKRTVYSEASLTRLQAIKAKYDPANLFHLNLNVEPATAG